MNLNITIKLSSMFPRYLLLYLLLVLDLESKQQKIKLTRQVLLQPTTREQIMQQIHILEHFNCIASRTRPVQAPEQTLGTVPNLYNLTDPISP